MQIPISVLERFWSLGGFQVRKFCRRLHDFSLLLEFNVDSETVRLHDIVRRILIEQVGDGLPDLHRHLINAFKPASGWSDLQVEEKYLWRNLAGHLLGAERKDELRRLLTDFPFLQAKLNATDVNALIADYQSFVDEERELQLIHDALRLSMRVLTQDCQQLASQLFGRLAGTQGKRIEQLLGSAEAQLRLKPRQGTLAPAGVPLSGTLEGGSWVAAVAVVDGHRAVSGSYDGKLRVWDLKTGESLRTLQGQSWVSAVAVVDGHRAIFSSLDRTLRVWDLETGETLRTLRGHSGGVRAVAVVDAHRVISGSDDRTLRVWDLETAETIRILEGHLNGISSVEVVDGRRAVSGSYDGTLRVWDLETGETLRIFQGQLLVSAVAVVDGRRAILGSYDGTLRVWDLETGETLRTLEGHSDVVSEMAIVDGRWVVSGSWDRRLRMWDLETGENLAVVTLDAPVRAVAVSPDGRIVVAGDEVGKVHFLDLVEPPVP